MPGPAAAEEVIMEVSGPALLHLLLEGATALQPCYAG